MSSYFKCNECGGRWGTDCHGNPQKLCPLINATLEQRQAHHRGETVLEYPPRVGPPTERDFNMWTASVHVMFSEVDEDGYFAIRIEDAFSYDKVGQVFAPGDNWVAWLGTAVTKYHRRWLRSHAKYKLTRKPRRRVDA
ncbi:hypothetical protein [Mycolicibacterium sphagni]|uniref:hypothetical protein n=1 Tax=Mycolicibacterium sphagni TaxID=1786 RepID=UPI0021F3951A|nr:hypothetical protein [Mycolicibacterium sphagni]MCV7174806.1 hypothetical protein [Mycolicibacterium sphagni]